MTSLAALRRALEESAATLAAFLEDEENLLASERFAESALLTLQRGGRLFSCGNGGSMSDAMHFAEEWTGRFRKDREPLPAMAFSDPAALSCIANDFGYQEVFARQLEAHGRAGDLLVTLSTSGESTNLLRAAAVAKELDITVVALLGRGGGKLASEVDIPIIVPRATSADRIQEVHLQVLHAVIETVERQLFPGNYSAPERSASFESEADEI
jgi:D-sedoheptulose 7-phosphate isomerase